MENFHNAQICNFPKGLIHDLILKIEFLHVLNKKETFLDPKNAHVS